MGNRTALYLTDRQYTDLLKALTDAKTYHRSRDLETWQEVHAIAPISGIEREIYEQVIVIKAGE